VASTPSTNTKQREDRARSIFALLGRLALHYYRPDFAPSQAKLVIEDMIEDLLEYDPQEIAAACSAWRRKPEAAYFPKSGQLIGCIKEAHEARIPHPGGHARESFRASEQFRREQALAGPQPVALKPWRQILAEKGKALPAPEAEAPPKPAQQETLLPDGSLTEQRRAELAELAARVCDVALVGGEHG
jgi:hypothetical protein